MPTKRKKKFTEEDEVEVLQKEIRELKALNRSLMKRLKKVDRFYNESLEEDKQEEYKEIKEAIPKCPSCNKGELIRVTVVGRSFARCPLCNYREKATKVY